MKRIQLAAGLLLTSIFFTGCGSSASSNYDTNYQSAATMETATEEIIYEDAAGNEKAEYEAEDTEILEEGADTAAQERKLIKTVDLYVETENYDALLANLEKQIETLGGYVEYRYQYNGSHYSYYEELRNVQLEIRIPSDRLDEFIGKVEEQSNVIDRQEQVEDVTLKYVDLESHKTVLVTEQERLLELLEQAETVEDIIALEQRLSEVRYELESMESQLRTLDNQIDYSTINLNIGEVQRVTPATNDSLVGRIKNGIMDSIYDIGRDVEDGFVWFVIRLPYLFVWIAVLFIILIFGKMVSKHRKKKKAARSVAEKRLAEEAEKAEKELEEKIQEEDKNRNGER